MSLVIDETKVSGAAIDEAEERRATRWLDMATVFLLGGLFLGITLVVAGGPDTGKLIQRAGALLSIASFIAYGAIDRYVSAVEPKGLSSLSLIAVAQKHLRREFLLRGSSGFLAVLGMLVSGFSDVLIGLIGR